MQVTDALTRESGRFMPDIYTRSAWKSPIVALQGRTRGQWMNARGATQNILTYDRSLPTTATASQWTDVTASNGDSNNACLPPILNVAFSQTTRTTNLRHVAVQTPYFCIEDIRTAFEFVEQLKKHTAVLANVSAWIWRDRMYQDYYDIAEHNVTINQSAGFYDNGGNGYSAANPANGELTYYHLEALATDIVLREGGEDAPGRDIDTGQPTVELIMGPEMQRNLLRKNAELRQDIRYSTMGEGMQSPLLPYTYAGKRKSFGGFTISTEVYPRRFSIVNGAYVEVPVWTPSATTIGNQSVINPDWLTAPTEEVIMWMPNVYQSLVPNTLTQPASGWKFDPVSYMGDFRAVNIPERVCNPDGTMIFWRAIFEDAAKPVKPQVGVTILAARCNLDTRTVPCGYVTPTGNGGYIL